MNIQRVKNCPGLTLIELTIVILVLLSLTLLLVFSAQAYIEGTNRAKCIVNMSNIQRSLVSYANMNNVDPANWSSLTLADAITVSSTASQQCPSGSTDYVVTPTLSQDQVWVTCGSAATYPLHVLNF